MTLNRLLAWFVGLWVAGLVTLTFIDLWRELSTAPNLWEAWNRFADFGSPFNLWYFMTRMFMLAPAALAYAWLEIRKERDQSK